MMFPPREIIEHYNTKILIFLFDGMDQRVLKWILAKCIWIHWTASASSHSMLIGCVGLAAMHYLKHGR